MNTPLISVIIPVYNTESFLKQCINSILGQTYQNWELLLINDGSTDGSPQICNEYQKKDSRIHVFHQANSGVSAARNLGIMQAKGKWITFVDSDDWVENRYLESFKTDADLNLQGLFYGNKRIVYTASAISQNPAAMYIRKGFVYGPYCKLFKIDIIRKNHLRFNEKLSFGEDLLFTMQYLIHCKSLSVVSYSGYHYMLRNTNSLIHRVHPYQEIIDMYTLHMQCLEHIFRTEPDGKRRLRNKTLEIYRHLFNRYNVRYRHICADNFLNYCYKTHLNLMDRLFIRTMSQYIPFYYKLITCF